MFDKNRADKIETDRDNLRMFVWMSVITLVFAILVWLGLCNHVWHRRLPRSGVTHRLHLFRIHLRLNRLSARAPIQAMPTTKALSITAAIKVSPIP